MDQMVCVPEVNLRVDLGTTGAVKEVSNERKRIMVLFGDPVESTKIHTEMERTVLLLYEEDRSSMRRSRLANESSSEILVDELPESRKLSQRQGVEMTGRNGSIVLQVNVEVVESVRG